ncbi:MULTISPECIES: DUF924 family protein [Moraxella]|uniref:DUF924 domain-containing protein n=1 Tax=Moraxella nasicaprae TaxID=2904122 RepID=A0ABY6F5J9_9GAMM|nr:MULTISPECIES: DUF924 family protein [Moraxella]MDO4894085.1 DUF924 family protein [Moraxella sp.]UXZ05369.1 DUF924 domain-containing protein [Moraxella nasicaprae]
MSHSYAVAPNDILDFWFHQDNQAFWFVQNDDFDRTISQQFYETWTKAIEGELYHWRTTLQGRLAEIIVLDQFSRNLHRQSKEAFAYDLTALVLAQEAINQPDFASLNPSERHFMLMPLMHSESADIHHKAVALFEALGNPKALDFELQHKAIIDRFGRYPHRNAVLGRDSTPDELEFLKSHSGF